MTTLAAGDIAIVEYEGNFGDAEYSFVLLTSVDQNTTIGFTDRGWIDENSNSAVNDGYYANNGTPEGIWDWTAPAGGLAAGTVVTISQVPNGSQGGGPNLTTNVGSVTNNQTGNAFRIDFADQIIAYQGTFSADGSGMTELFGINVSGVGFFSAGTQAEWNGVDLNGPNSDSSGLPPGLTPGVSALAITDMSGDFNDGNAAYSGTLSGTQAELLAAIANPANWTFSGATAPATPGPFSVASPGTPPVVATNTGSSVAEGGDDEISAAELQTTDADTAAASLIYTLDSSVTNGVLYLDNDGSNTFSGGDTPLNAAGTFTQQDIDNGNLRYAHSSNETTTDSFQFDVTDGSNPVNNQAFNFAITPVNDAAVVSNLDLDVRTFLEALPNPVNLDNGSDATLSDNDHPVLNGGSLTVSLGGTAQAEDMLQASNFGGAGIGFGSGFVTFGGNVIGTYPTSGAGSGLAGADLVVSFTTPQATVVAVQGLIRELQYVNNGGDNPTTTARTATVVVNDGANNSNVSSITINIASVDDPAVASDDAIAISDDLNATTGISLFAANPTTADIDPDSLFSITSVQGGMTPQATANGGIVSVTDGTNGIVTYDPNGAFEYLAAGVTASDTFTYEITGGSSATVTLTITGVDNNDTFDGTAGGVIDTINAGVGADMVSGLSGNDVLNGEAGNDTINGGKGSDIIDGGSDNDLLYGANGDDLMNGGDGDDRIKGNNNRDTLNGDVGMDDLFGGAANDVLNGGADNDRLYAGQDNDVLNGGAGDDILRGGAGTDIFIFETGNEIDRVRDFEDGVDMIDLSSFGSFATAVSILATGVDVNGSARFFSGGDTLIVENVSVVDLDNSDFFMS